MDIGLISVGDMGFPTARRLLDAGHSVAAFDTSTQRFDMLVALGACAGNSPKDVGDQPKTVFANLPTPRASLAVATGQSGLIEGTWIKRIEADGAARTQTKRALQALRYRVHVSRADWRGVCGTDRARRPVAPTADAHRTPARRLSIRYAARLVAAHLLAVADAAAIVIPLHSQTANEAHEFFSAKNAITVLMLVVLGSIAVATGGVLNLAPVLRWFVVGQEPDARQRRTAMRLVRRQSMILAATWATSAVIFILLNLGSAALSVATVLAVVFGGIAAESIGLLLTQRSLRPILVAATQGSEGGVVAPRVLTRLVGMWLLGSGLPCAAIATLVVIRSNGWIIAKTASVEIPVLVVTLAAVLLGLPAMILTSRSISDPIREVVDAMAQVEKGQISTFVGVYEHSEIGRLQSGFNRMVAGIAERDRLRDLFGRHVGADVARRAIEEEGASLSGDVREVAILFIDLVGSTQLAGSRSPHEVAKVLNDFFRIVVDAVDERHGLINKFQGDAALAVFGAPLPARDAVSAALATARSLRSQLRRLPLVDFGLGVSAGPVFAGNIGSENRYEYTVIGDAVNEAARLADFAKTLDRRIVCSAAAINRADATERRYWVSHGDTVLRGRSESTDVWIPR